MTLKMVANTSAVVLNHSRRIQVRFQWIFSKCFIDYYLVPTAIHSSDKPTKTSSSPEKKATTTTPKKETKPKQPIKKFGTQSETAKIIYVFRNGDKNHEGVKMTIHHTKFKNFDQVLILFFSILKTRLEIVPFY